MKTYDHLFLLFLQSLISAALFCSTAVASTGNAQQQDASPAYTNKDLDQYSPAATAGESPASEAARASGDRKSDSRQRSDAGTDKKEQEYWCKKARQVKKSLAMAKDEVDEHTARLNELTTARAHTTGKKMASLEKKQNKTSRELKAAGKRLRERQETLAELEDDAYRSNVPAGWLRCQFE